MLNFRTFKQDCCAHISLRADEKGNFLKIRSVNIEHNHEISQVRIIVSIGAKTVIPVHVGAL